MSTKKRNTFVALLVAVIGAAGAGGVVYHNTTRNVALPDSTLENLIGYMITADQLLAMGDSLAGAFNEALDEAAEAFPTPPDSLIFEILRTAKESERKLDSLVTDIDKQGNRLDDLTIKTNGILYQVREIKREVDFIIETAPEVYIIEGDSITPADSVRLKWSWPQYRPFPKKVPVDDN